MLNDTNASWPLKPLSEVVDLNPRLDKSAYLDDLEVSFVPMAAVEAGSGRMEVSQTKHFSAVKKGYTPFKESDVLFAKITPCMENGKMAVVPKLTSGLGFGSTEFHVLRPHEGIDPRFVYYFVSSQDFRREAAHRMTGAVGQKRVPQSFLGEALIPVPLFDDQKSIVAEIEKQFSRLDEALANLKRVKANLKRYKASVLKAAVEGRLTEDWRLSARAASRKRAQASELEAIPKARKDKWFVYIIECNDGSYYVGHTADLHARWKAHCEGNGADWTRQHPPKYLVHFAECGNREDAVKREQDLKTGFGRTWRKREIDAGRMKPLVHNPANETAQPVHDEDMQTGSKLLERILAERREKWSGKGKYKEPGMPDVRNLPQLPQRWAWCLTDALFSYVTSGSRGWAKYYSDEGSLFLRVGNLDHDSIRLDLSDVQRVNPPAGAEGTRTNVERSDILISITADVGMIAVIPPNLGEAYINQHIALARPVLGICREYLAWYLAARDGGQKQFQRLQRGATKVGLGLDDVRAVPVPLPPLAEQEQIVAEVERRLSVIEELEATVEANLTRADRLRQAVLRNAFTGNLLAHIKHHEERLNITSSSEESECHENPFFRSS